MKEDSVIFIGLDTSKLKISVAVADGGRNGEVRFFGDISSEPVSVAAMVKKLSKNGAKLHFCYEAGPPATVFTVRLSNWAMTAWWWRRR
jgi:transposase